MNALASAAGKPSAKNVASTKTAASGKISAYLVGAACGAALVLPLAALPLAAAALGVGSTPASVAAQGQVLPAFQAHQVNRAGKGARLDLRLPAPTAGTSMMAKTTAPERSLAARSPVREGTSIAASEPAASPIAQGLPPAADKAPRAARPPKGCASTLGPVARLATDEITVCVASL